jgi:hypothetical protein
MQNSVSSISASEYESTFASHTFTNCSTVGRRGPSLSACRLAYGTNWVYNKQFLNMETQGIQIWTVPKTGTYEIEVWGAAGGKGDYGVPNSNPSYQSMPPGQGQKIKETFSLQKSHKLLILVGQKGALSNRRGWSAAGGGGGGTFVVDKTTGNPLIIAAGGNGAGHHSHTGVSINGQPTYDDRGTPGNGGRGGNTDPYGRSGGGGGMFIDGIIGDDSDLNYLIGKSFINGGVGGERNWSRVNDSNLRTKRNIYATGGFGGGGGSQYEGGGGGGYVGGDVVKKDDYHTSYPTYGAGSFIEGVASGDVIDEGLNTGHGQVKITYIPDYLLSYSVNTFTISGTTATFTMADAAINTTLAYTISHSGGGTDVIGTVENVRSSTESVSSIDISGLNVVESSVLTLSVTLSDALYQGLSQVKTHAVSYVFTSHTFTSCGATERNGPTLQQCTDTYTEDWADNDYWFNVSKGIQIWNVPETGTYSIDASGARGGTYSSSTAGGYGAQMIGTFDLSEGDKIHIIVGQEGVGINVDHDGGTGAGGSYVVKSPAAQASDILVIAGGGGGGGLSGDTHNYHHGQTGTSGGTYDSLDAADNGNGGTRGSDTQGGGAGGGFLTDGADGHSVNDDPNYVGYSTGGESFLNGSMGGTSTGHTTYFLGDVYGGFGGGGGMSNDNVVRGSGGGGYSGGIAGSWSVYVSGGGGGSINNGTSKVNIGGIIY